MKDETPTWIKIMQNGTLGEARTKAFLIDRFWILERSIDINGADFIIQRRVTQQNLLDQKPPRFGVVQAKFYETEDTTQYIHKEYIVDNDDNPRDEFFLVCHTGNEEHSRIFFLSAKMIVEDFAISEFNGSDKYRLPGKVLLNNNKYLVTSKKNVLDRMEQQLKLADFTKNRMFISWQLPSADVDTSAILPDFSEPIDNWWGDIPKGFKKLKDETFLAMRDVEEAYIKLKQISESVDPLQAIEVLDDLAYYCRDGQNKWSISLPDLYDPEFESVCRDHLEKVNNLRNKGLLDTYIGLKKVLKENISTYLTANLPIDSNTIYSVIIDFSAKDFTINSFQHKLVSASNYFSIPDVTNKFGHVEVDTQNYRGIKDISDGQFEYFWLAGRIHISEEDKLDLKSFYANTDFTIYFEIMEKMYYDFE